MFSFKRFFPFLKPYVPRMIAAAIMVMAVAAVNLALLRLGGTLWDVITVQHPVIVQETIHSDGRESYLRAVVQREGTDYTAITTGNQGSHMMTSLVKANALLIIPEGITLVNQGETLSALMLDWPETVF